MNESNDTVRTNWFSDEHCEKCLHKLSNREIYYGGGVCPYCAHDSNGTICDTIKNHFRYIYEIRKFLGLIPYRKFLRIEFKQENP